MQLRHLQQSLCSRGSNGAPSFAGAGTARATAARTPRRPTLALAAGRSWPKTLQPSTCLGQSSMAAAGANPRGGSPAPRSAARSEPGASSTGLQVGGKLLLESFVESPSSQLRLSLQLVSATVAA
ncbi:hypothetical protein ACP70R_021319 [Stipagrostis hirtigluma subsp. patula]